ncbi:MAG: ABC transporter substrate-binding protein [Phycisphaerales bacterium]|nr:MAG: ABC transporter substrate-binding protein [Phycisphaerales bacterium]
MQNRFGLKDFVLLVLLIIVLVVMGLSMAQEDRRWSEVRTVQDQIDRLEQQVMMMSQRLEDGIVAAPASGQTGAGSAQRDDSWARAGVEIEWQQPFTLVNDPRGEEDYAMGGTYTEIFGAQPPTITPLIYRDVYGIFVIDQVVESLGRYNPETLDMEGVLAEAWQYDPSGMWLRVLIRPNARFSDGQPVTAHDVKFSHDLGMNPQIESDRYRAVYGIIDSVEVIDDRVVEFNFTEPKFNNRDVAMGVPVLPKHFYEDISPTQFNQSTGLLMGSGPYRLRNLSIDNQYRPGRDDIVLVRNEQYWGPRPAIDRLRYTVIVEDIAALTAYNNRNADMMTPTPRQFTQFRDNEAWLERNRAKLWFNLRGGYSFIAWNTRSTDGRESPFADPRVRRAMTHLLDRQAIIDNILMGIGEIATGPFNPRTDQANPDITPHEYNLDKARQLLAEAGWTEEDGVLRNERGDRFDFRFTYSTGAETTRRIADYLRDQCNRVGIRMRPDPVDWSIYADRLRNRDFDAITMAWSPSSPESDPYQIWHSDQIAGGGDNFISWRNDRADELIDLGRQEIDTGQRMAYWHELHQIIHEEQPYTFLAVRPWLRFINRRNQNVHPYMTGIEQREFYIPRAQQASPM